jgi:hypothetical protein
MGYGIRGWCVQHSVQLNYVQGLVLRGEKRERAYERQTETILCTERIHGRWISSPELPRIFSCVKKNFPQTCVETDDVDC